MWFEIDSVGLDFTETSPFQIVNTGVIRARPERVFDIMTNGEGWHDWFQDYVDTRWTSSEPYGVDSTREVELKMLTVKERFLAWDRGKRLTFCIHAITLPLVSAMIEDLRFEKVDEDKTKLLWTVHYRPTLLFRAIHPIGRAVFGNLFANTLTGLRAYAAEHP